MSNVVQMEVASWKDQLPIGCGVRSVVYMHQSGIVIVEVPMMHIPDMTRTTTLIGRAFPLATWICVLCKDGVVARYARAIDGKKGWHVDRSPIPDWVGRYMVERKA